MCWLHEEATVNMQIAERTVLDLHTDYDQAFGTMQ
jgi:hypothetical protein